MQNLIEFSYDRFSVYVDRNEITGMLYLIGL